jgi:hypothetical protein
MKSACSIIRAPRYSQLIAKTSLQMNQSLTTIKRIWL